MSTNATDLEEQVAQKAQFIQKTLDSIEDVDDENFDEWFKEAQLTSIAQNSNAKQAQNKSTDEKHVVFENDDVSDKSVLDEPLQEDKQEIVNLMNDDENKIDEQADFEEVASHKMDFEEVTSVKQEISKQDSHEALAHNQADTQRTSPKQETTAKNTTSNDEDITKKNESKTSVPKRKHEKHHRFNKNGGHKSVPEQVNSQSERKVEVNLSDNKPKSEQEILNEQTAHKNKVMQQLKQQADELEKSSNLLNLTTDDLQKNSETYNAYIKFLFGKFILPSNLADTVRSIDYINSIITLKYNPYETPNEAMKHSLPENIITFNKLNKIFNQDIVTFDSNNYHFDDLDAKICQFLEQYKHVLATKLEYEFIRNFAVKLIYNLNTSTELAFREKNVQHVDAKYKKAIMTDVNILNDIQSQQENSWSKFINNFFGFDGESMVYTFKNYDILNKQVKEAYEKQFVFEELFANMLKIYAPSISINYIYAIKSIYITARLFSVYFDMKQNHFGLMSIDEIMTDLNVIAHVGTCIYEIKYHIFQGMARSLPECKNEMHEKTKMYILNHIFTGGQYYLLKYFERALPAIAYLIKHE